MRHLQAALLLIISAVAFSHVLQQFECEKKCGEGAECKLGPKCPETCGVSYAGDKECMPRNLVVGCYCKQHDHILADGFSNSCIPKKECTRNEIEGLCISAINMTYNACASDCGDLNCDASKNKENCNDACLMRCVCKPGFKFNEDDDCVLAKDC